MSTRPPLTILYVHASDELYGSDVMLLRLIRGLDRTRFRPVVALPNDLDYSGLLSQELKRLDVPTYKLDLAVVRRRYLKSPGLALFPLRLARATAQLSQLIRREDVALVHSNTVVVWPGALAARISRKPHVWQVHELLSGLGTLRHGVGYALQAMSDVVVSNSEATWSALFPPGSDRTRAPVIYNTLDAPTEGDEAARDRIREEWDVSPGDILIGTVGRISHRKGQRELLQAAEDIVRSEPGVRFVIVGDAVPGHERYVEKLRAAAEVHGLSDRVRFAGFRSDVASILEALDLFVLPVLQPESFGLAAVEAMAHGKAVVASRAGALAEVVQDGRTGILVPPGDVPALTAAVLKLARDSELRERMGAAGRERAESEFSTSSRDTRFEAMYERLAAGAPP